MKKNSIFVVLFSYENEHVVDTVKSLISHADHPDLLSFGICYQGDNFDVLHALIDIKNVRLIHKIANVSKGMGWAINKIAALLDDEEYVLRTGACMRAVDHWDSYFIAAIATLGNKAVISNVCKHFDYSEPHPIDCYKSNIICAAFLKRMSCLVLEKGKIVDSNRFIRGINVSSMCIFGKSDFLLDCKDDNRFTFFTEEMFYTLQLWTHGYDVWYAPYCYLYHFSTSGNDDGLRKQEDDSSAYSVLHRYEMCYLNRNNNMTIDSVPLGDEKSIRNLELIADVDFTKGRMGERLYFGNLFNAFDSSFFECYKFYQALHVRKLDRQYLDEMYADRIKFDADSMLI